MSSIITGEGYFKRNIPSRMSKRKVELLDIPEVRDEYFRLCANVMTCDVHALAEFFKSAADKHYTERQYVEPHKKIIDGWIKKYDNAFMTKDSTNKRYYRNKIVDFFNNVELKDV